MLPVNQLSFIKERYRGIGKDSMTLSWLVNNALMTSTVIYYLCTDMIRSVLKSSLMVYSLLCSTTETWLPKRTLRSSVLYELSVLRTRLLFLCRTADVPITLFFLGLKLKVITTYSWATPSAPIYKAPTHINTQAYNL